jgi:ABC-type siderophore export system fused ATPase/permease subunit
MIEFSLTFASFTTVAISFLFQSITLIVSARAISSVLAKKMLSLKLHFVVLSYWEQFFLLFLDFILIMALLELGLDFVWPTPLGP